MDISYIIIEESEWYTKVKIFVDFIGEYKVTPKMETALIMLQNAFRINDNEATGSYIVTFHIENLKYFTKQWFLSRCKEIQEIMKST